MSIDQSGNGTSRIGVPAITPFSGAAAVPPAVADATFALLGAPGNAAPERTPEKSLVSVFDLAFSDAAPEARAARADRAAKTVAAGGAGSAERAWAFGMGRAAQTVSITAKRGWDRVSAVDAGPLPEFVRYENPSVPGTQVVKPVGLSGRFEPAFSAQILPGVDRWTHQFLVDLAVTTAPDDGVGLWEHLSTTILNIDRDTDGSYGPYRAQFERRSGDVEFSLVLKALQIGAHTGAEPGEDVIRKFLAMLPIADVPTFAGGATFPSLYLFRRSRRDPRLLDFSYGYGEVPDATAEGASKADRLLYALRSGGDLDRARPGQIVTVAGQGDPYDVAIPLGQDLFAVLCAGGVATEDVLSAEWFDPSSPKARQLGDMVRLYGEGVLPNLLPRT